MTGWRTLFVGLRRAATVFARALLALVALRFLRRQPASTAGAGGQHSSPLERVVAGLMFAAAGCFVAFVVFYIADQNTQLLGLALGLGIAGLAAAAVVAGRWLVPQETVVEERPQLADEHAQTEATGLVQAPARSISRRRLLGAAAGVAGAGLGAALIAPAASLGPNIGSRLKDTPWRAGRRLVDESERPVSADDIEPKSLVTAFPEGAEHRELGAPVVLVRVAPDQLELPADRAGWAPEGILAFSKICTHAACAISLYRAPTYEPTSRNPALVCPCHYSTFDVRRAAKVIFGPAGRPLPQLPLRITDQRELVATGGFSGPVGPAWWGVRQG